jgi:hypothetical protein
MSFKHLLSSASNPSRTAFVLALLCAPLALAVPLDTTILIDSESDLYELVEREELDQTELERLIEVYREGVDLNAASRDDLYELPNLTYKNVDDILLYRETSGFIEDPADLVAAGVLTGDQLKQIAPFLVMVDRGKGKLPFTGHAEVGASATNADTLFPPTYLRAGTRGPWALRTGLILLGSRRIPGAVFLDSGRARLSANPEAFSVQPVSYYVQWKAQQWSVIAGTYQVGFAERLTLDTTSRYTPNGMYADDSFKFISRDDFSSVCRRSTGDLPTADDACTDADRTTHITPDFKASNRLRGVAARLEDVPLGSSSKLALTAFGSFQNHSLYQTELFNRATCADPRDDDATGCRAPSIYVSGPDPTLPQPSFRYTTLPYLYDELMAGGNTRLDLGTQVQVGVTGYYSNIFWRVPGASLDFQEYAEYPMFGPFGAVGVNGGYRIGLVGLTAEASRSFNSDPVAGGGGYGVVQRTVLSLKKHELEGTFRYYDSRYLNPHAGSISEPDEFEGQRQRNEAGYQLKYNGKLNEDWKLSANLDAWLWPEFKPASSPGEPATQAGTANIKGRVRGTFMGWSWVNAGAWVDYGNRDLRVGGRGQCYGLDEGDDTFTTFTIVGDDDTLSDCKGEMYAFAGELKFWPKWKLFNLDLGYRHTLIDDSTLAEDAAGTKYRQYGTSFRNDAKVWVRLHSKPIDTVILDLRTIFRDQALDDPTLYTDEQYVWSRFKVGWAPSRYAQIDLRYDLLFRLDQRRVQPTDPVTGLAITGVPPILAPRAYVPNPSHRLTLSFESWF